MITFTRASRGISCAQTVARQTAAFLLLKCGNNRISSGFRLFPSILNRASCVVDKERHRCTERVQRVLHIQHQYCIHVHGINLALFVCRLVPSYTLADVWLSQSYKNGTARRFKPYICAIEINSPTIRGLIIENCLFKRYFLKDFMVH